jgi:hypothetical protein
MRSIFKIVISTIDILISPLTLLSSLLLLGVRKFIVGFWEDYSYFKISRKIFTSVGVFPIINHYYEPIFSFDKSKKAPGEVRWLPGINMNTEEQLAILSAMDYSQELIAISLLPESRLNYSFEKGPFRSGDAEFLYSFVRSRQPATIIEIGCGHSTLVIQHAISKNREHQQDFICDHVCIEPYENEWLKNLNVTVKKELIELLPLDFFKKLKAGDLLFIDSSHIIRPEGDVLFEILRLLPILPKGVYVHFHDIFTPRDYLKEWMTDGLLFWNEQYLLEAYLSDNPNFKIIGAINYLKHNHYKELNKICPFLTPEREPGSFWIQKVA